LTSTTNGHFPLTALSCCLHITAAAVFWMRIQYHRCQSSGI